MPISGCWIDANWQEHGLTRIVVALEMSPQRFLVGIYLVDYFCLGVKDCDWKIDISTSSLSKQLPQFCGNPKPCKPDYAHELIYGALAYAERYGFPPHADFQKAGLILGPLETYPPHYNFEFGKDGKPFFIPGPYDNPRRVIATLERTAGRGNYHYLVGVDDPGKINLF